MPTTKQQLSCFMALSPDIPGEPAPEQSVVLQFCVAPGGGYFSPSHPVCSGVWTNYKCVAIAIILTCVWPDHLECFLILLAVYQEDLSHIKYLSQCEVVGFQIVLSRLIGMMHRRPTRCIHKKTRPTTFEHSVIKPQLKASFLSASLYFSKSGAYWDRLCRDVVGRWLVVTRVHCGQMVHPRPIGTMDH